MPGVSEQAAAEVMAAFRAEFNAYLQDEDAPTWSRRLTHSGGTDENIKELYMRFGDTWAVARKPTLHDLALFVREQVVQERPRVRQSVEGGPQYNRRGELITDEDRRVGRACLARMRAKLGKLCRAWRVPEATPR